MSPVISRTRNEPYEAQRLTKVARAVGRKLGLTSHELGDALLRDIAKRRRVFSRRRMQDNMRRKGGVSAKAQTALLELSQRLLAAKDEQTVIECAVELAASMLGTEHSTLVLAQADGRLIARAVQGWPAEMVERFSPGSGTTSLAGYTVLCGHPIVVED